MENLASSSFSSHYDYMHTIERHRYRVENILAETDSPDNGTLAWPGDLELLAVYKVTPEDILKKIVEKINASKIPQMILQSKLIGCQMKRLDTVLDHYSHVKPIYKDEISLHLRA